MTANDTTKRPLGTRWCKTAIVLASLAGVGAVLGLGGGAMAILNPLIAFSAFGIGMLLFVIAILTSIVGLALSKGTAGDASVVVPKNQVMNLDAGAYNHIFIRPGGTLVLTGTPEGVLFRLGTLWNPAAYLQEGDVVTSFGTYLGYMRNEISAR